MWISFPGKKKMGKAKKCRIDFGSVLYKTKRKLGWYKTLALSPFLVKRFILWNL